MTTPIEDNMLHAWLDDELSSEQRAVVDLWLRDHPHDAARVRLWAADREALRVQLNPILAEPVPDRLAHAVWRRGYPRSAPRWQLFAAALVLFVLGIAIGAAPGWRMRPLPSLQRAAPSESAPMAWVQRALLAHNVYTPEVRHPVEVSAQEAHLARWLTNRLNVQVKLFDLSGQGFELIGGRLLPDTPGPSAQLMYQQRVEPGAGAGTKPLRVTLYVRKPEDDTPASFRFEQREGLGMFYWVEGASSAGAACGYALVGAIAREQLLALAEAIYHQR